MSSYTLEQKGTNGWQTVYEAINIDSVMAQYHAAIKSLPQDHFRVILNHIIIQNHAFE